MIIFILVIKAMTVERGRVMTSKIFQNKFCCKKKEEYVFTPEYQKEKEGVTIADIYFRNLKFSWD
mgnify:CR=1 FL=1